MEFQILNRTLFFGAFLLLFCGTGYGQPAFTMFIPESYSGRDVKVTALADGGWAVFATDSSRLYRFNACGKLDWARDYHLPVENFFGLDFFIATRRGGFAFLHRILGAEFAHSQFTLVDEKGNVVWSRLIHRTDYLQTPYSIGQDAAGNFMLYANASKIGGGEVFNMLMKIREDGTTAWTRFYDHGGIWGGAISTSDRGFLARTGPLLIKTDSLGEVEWSTMVYSGTDNYLTPVEVSDGYWIPGNSKSQNRIAFYKLSRQGKPAFAGSKALSLSGRPPLLRLLPNGNLAGVLVRSFGIPSRPYPALLELDPEMNLLRMHAPNFRQGTPFISQGLDLDFLPDGSALIAGGFQPEGEGGAPGLFVARTGRDMNFACDTLLPAESFGDAGGTLSVPTQSFPVTFQNILVPLSSSPLETNLLWLCGMGPLPPEINLRASGSICEGKPVTLKVENASGFDSVIWSNGEKGESITVAAPGMYRVKAYHPCHKIWVEDSLRVTGFSFPEIPWVADTNFCDGDTLTWEVLIRGAEYRWEDSSRLPYRKFYRPGRYTLEIRLNGCRKILTTHIHECEILEMPNFFTPNGDGRNDRFVAGRIRGIPWTELTIFNRWGKEITTLRDLKTEGWDGRDALPGIYYWRLRYRNFENQQKEKYGWVQKD